MFSFPNTVFSSEHYLTGKVNEEVCVWRMEKSAAAVFTVACLGKRRDTHCTIAVMCSYVRFPLSKRVTICGWRLLEI